MGWFVQVVGVGLVLLALIDIFLTVLYPRSHVGVLSAPFSRRVWRLFRLAAHFRPMSRNLLLSYSGPILLLMTVVVWVALEMSGFALIAWPVLGSAIQASQGPTSTDFVTALYYSGYALTTLGTGDIVPKTSLYRLLMVLETVIGLSSLTLVLTYFQSVYATLIRRNTFALSLQHRSAGTGDAVELLTRLGPREDFYSAHQAIADMAKDLLSLLESERTYPVLHYFRFEDAYYGLPHIIFLSMDTVSLLRSTLNPKEHASLIHSAAVAELWGSGAQLLVELSKSFLKDRPITKGQPEQEWWKRYYWAVERLRAGGVETVVNLEAGADLYISLRCKWEPYVAVLAEYLAYEWSEVTVTEGNWPRYSSNGKLDIPFEIDL